MAKSGLLWLLVGDVIVLGLVTVLGFASHGTVGSAGGRMLTTYIPLVVSWLLIAPFLGVYNPSLVIELRQLWRPFWAMVLAAPFAAWMRGAILGTAILPVFVVVLGGISALAILAWRFMYWAAVKQLSRKNG